MPKHSKRDLDNDEDDRKKKKHKRRHDDREHSDESEFRKKPKQYLTSEDDSPRSRRHRSPHEYTKKRKNSSSPHPHHRRIKEERRSEERNSQNDRRDRQRNNPNIRIKKEEDFDRRQEELSRRRRTDNNERRQNDDIRRRERQRRDRDGRTEEAFTKPIKTEDGDEKNEEKEKPNLGLSGALTEDTNTYRGVVIKYNEPPEARKPKKRWRLYPFKGTEALKTLYLHRQSAFLLGRQRRIADIPVDHPSCSKQHAVLQFRMMEVDVDGELRRRVRPYIIDLGSANGTYVNNERIEAQRYVELKEQDVLKFGFSSREYVLLHDKSDTTNVQENSSEEEED